MTYFLPYRELEERITDTGHIRHRFLKCRRICDNIELLSFMICNLSNGRSPLYTERGFVIASLESLSRIRQEEHPVTVHKVIKVCSTILCAVLIRKYNQMQTVMVKTGNGEPSCRKKESAAEDFLLFLQYFRNSVYGFRTY